MLNNVAIDEASNPFAIAIFASVADKLALVEHAIHAQRPALMLMM